MAVIAAADGRVAEPGKAGGLSDPYLSASLSGILCEAASHFSGQRS